MKSLFFALVLTLTAFAQSGRIEVVTDTLGYGDTTYVRNFVGNYRWVYIAYTDTGSTYADSVKVYVSAGTDSTTWVQVPLYDPIEDVTTSVITNPADTKLYLIYIPRPNWVKLVLANSGGGIVVGRRGQFVLRALNENY